jgi:hypothetical protein
MCQQCIKYGLATQTNKKGAVAVVRREKKKEDNEDEGRRGRGRK